MAATITATVGDASANSYATEAEFSTYMDGRLTRTAYDTATTDERVRALISAARRLDQETYKGVRVNATQAMQWPRYGVENPDLAYSVLDGPTFTESTWYDTDKIPQRVKNAQMELAYLILSGDFDPAPTGLEGYSAVVVGPIEVTPRHAEKAGEMPEGVYREIRPLVKTGRGTFRRARG